MQGVEALFPQLSIATDPRFDFRKWLRTKAVHPPLRLMVHLHQTSLPQYSQVPGDARPGDRKKRGQLTHGGRTVPQDLKHGAPALIGQGMQNSFHRTNVPEGYVPVKLHSGRGGRPVAHLIREALWQAVAPAPRVRPHGAGVSLGRPTPPLAPSSISPKSESTAGQTYPTFTPNGFRCGAQGGNRTHDPGLTLDPPNRWGVVAA